MKVTVKGQVTIPRRVRETLGIQKNSEVDFVEEKGRFYLVKTDEGHQRLGFRRFRGIAPSGMSTDEILELTRETE